jgi:hypothetical protein
MPQLSQSPLVRFAVEPVRSQPADALRRLISLAQDADRAGFVGAAGDLLRLAHSVLEPGRALC